METHEEQLLVNHTPSRRHHPSTDGALQHSASVSNCCIEVDTIKSFSEPCTHSLIVPVWLHHESNPDDKVLVYALLDEQSNACLAKESVLERLNISGPEIELDLSTVLARQTIASRRITGLVVRGVHETAEIPLPETYTRDIIPARRSQIPRPETARRWHHLATIAEYLIYPKEDIDVGLLIGANCIRAIKPREIIPGDDDPYAKKTALGWGIVGRVTSNNSEVDSDICVNRIVTREVFPAERLTQCNFVLRTQIKEVLNPVQINRMFELNFNEKEEGRALSHDDRLFMQKVNEGICQRPDGHYEIPLPLRDENVRFSNNKDLALSRLNKLKRRLQNDGKYSKDYTSFMKGLLENNHAERVPQEELHLDNGRVWYIPHHGVYHPRKPEKIRVGFDCSAEYKGECLNRHLLQGPDLINNLVGVLCRFRKEQTAVMCDIDGMFHQVYENINHRNLRFLWWENGDFDSDPGEFRMIVHIFGATSSPGCANFALKTAANDYEDECGSSAANFVRQDFYVDDSLKSVPTAQDAIKLIEDVKTLCKRGGFRLHKLLSNDRDVIKAIPSEDLASDIKNLDLGRDDLPIERALGIQWCVESDMLRFRINLSNRPPTRRSILSTVSSVFDP